MRSNQFQEEEFEQTGAEYWLLYDTKHLSSLWFRVKLHIFRSFELPPFLPLLSRWLFSNPVIMNIMGICAGFTNPLQSTRTVWFIMVALLWGKLKNGSLTLHFIIVCWVLRHKMFARLPPRYHEKQCVFSLSLVNTVQTPIDKHRYRIRRVPLGF